MRLWKWRLPFAGKPSFLGRYLLYDRFSINRPAGAVNGTPADGVGGNRTIVDTNNVMSIEGGVFKVSGSPSNSDRLLYPALPARIAGQVLSFTTQARGTIVSVTSMGWGTSVANAIVNNGINYNGTNTLRVQNGTNSLYTLTDTNPVHKFFMVRRADGGYLFFQSDAYPRLLWIYSADSVNNVPKLYFTAGEANLSLGKVLIPKTLWLPTPLGYDTFSRANGGMGNTENLGPDSQGVNILPWVDALGTWAVNGNQAIATALSGGKALATVSTGQPDVILDVAMTRSAGVVGGLARYQDGNNYLIFYHDGTNAKCDQVVGGITTNLASAAAIYNPGNVLRLILWGETGWLFYSGGQVGSSFTVPISTYGVHGLYTTDLGNSLDNFSVFPYGTSGEYAALNSF